MRPTSRTSRFAEAVIEQIIKPVLPKNLIKGNVNYLVNPTGRFVVGGPQGDCGLTGRKIIVDTYGGAAHHGGGAFSGKDPVQGRPLGRLRRALRRQERRRRRARQQVRAAGLLRHRRRAPHQHHGHHVRYRQDPGREASPSWCSKHFDLRPKGIIQMLDLLRPIYLKTAAYGHFGRDEPEFSWENMDKVEALKADAGIGRFTRDAWTPVRSTTKPGDAGASSQFTAHTDGWRRLTPSAFGTRIGSSPIITAPRGALQRAPASGARQAQGCHHLQRRSRTFFLTERRA